MTELTSIDLSSGTALGSSGGKLQATGKKETDGLGRVSIRGQIN